MKGTIILRLVDITLLLLLSLMATASLTTVGSDLPVTSEIEDNGSLTHPIQIGLTANGDILTIEGDVISMDELEVRIASGPPEIELIADGNAPSGRLLEIHAMASQHHRHVAFRVRKVEGGLP